MDRQTLVLLPGWALGPEPLMPLAHALQAQLPGLVVECPSYSDLCPGLTSHRVDSWIATLDRELPQDVWLAGWSLGGMLATALARWRGRRVPGLITLGANASFVARPGWPQAMTSASFGDFQRGLRLSPIRTLRRFAQLSAQGGQDTRRLGRTLLAALEATPLDQAVTGLALLAELDLRDTLETLVVQHLHLFGANDVLVPTAAYEAIARRLPDSGQTAVLADAGHAFPLDRVDETAALMASFTRSFDGGGS